MSLKTVLIIQNHPIETPGRIGEYLEKHKIPFEVVHSYRGDEFPDPATLSAVINLGCPASVSDIQQADWAMRLFDYLDDVIEAEIAYLGICYGSQLMAANRGAAVLPLPDKEIGVYQLTLTSAGQSDPLFAGFPKTFPVFHWHGDMFDIPDGAENFATSEICVNQAYGRRNCWGIQFHLEVTSAKLEVWVKEYADELPDVSKSAEDVLAEYKAVEAETGRLCDLLMGNFLAACVESC